MATLPWPLSEQTARHTDTLTAPQSAEVSKMWIWILWIIVTPVSLFLALYELAKDDLFFTFLESGNIKYFRHGDTVVDIIGDINDEKVEGRDLKPASKTLLERMFGLYWVGIPPYANVLKFKVSRRKEREETTGKPPTEWIMDLGEREVDSLRRAFPRPILLEKAELGSAKPGEAKDRQTVDMLVVGKFVVVDAHIPIVELKGDFWELLTGLFRAAVLDIVERTGTMDAFIEANKGGGTDSILYELWKPDSDFNKVLVEKTGLKLVGAAIPQWDPSDEAVRKAMQLRFVAERERERDLIIADTYKQTRAINAEADALAEERIAKARGVRVRETAAGLAATLADQNVVAQATASVLRAEAHASKDSKIITVVDGNAPIVIPVPPGGGR